MRCEAKEAVGRCGTEMHLAATCVEDQEFYRQEWWHWWCPKCGTWCKQNVTYPMLIWYFPGSDYVG